MERIKATITRIDEPKLSRNGNAFIRVYFKTEAGHFAKTDICPDYRNYYNWKPYLKVGQGLANLYFKRAGEINADSLPVVWEKEQAATLF